MPNQTTLSEAHQEAVKRMLGTGKDPLSIRAIFRAVPERASHAKEAFEFAKSFSEIEVNVLADIIMDELLEAAERRAAIRRRMAEQNRIAKERAAARAAEAVEPAAGDVAAPDADYVLPSNKKLVQGHPVTGVIRWCASVGMDAEEIGQAILEVAGFEPNASTLKIQVKRFEKGEPVPELSQTLKAALMAAVK